jgi:DNA-binding transcriptional MocR family regulator
MCYQWPVNAGTALTPAARLVELLGEWRAGGPAHERLAATMRALILDGRIPIEGRLPAERTLAKALNASRATITAAYDQLRAEGYMSSRQGAGSWVTIPGGHRAAPEAAANMTTHHGDMRIGAMPAPALLDEIFKESAREVPRWLDHHGYDPLGLPPLREAIARRFSARGLPTRAEQILVTSGALHALDLITRASTRRGRAALVELPGYPAALDALRAGGLRLHGVPTDARGWDLEVLEALTRAHGPALAYLVPDFQNPTGALLDEHDRRRALFSLARADTKIVIDETFAELNLDHARMPPPAAALAPRSAEAITVGSLSKSVWGGLRIGWVRADPATVRRLAAARAAIDLASPVFEQIVAGRVLEVLDEIVAERRTAIASRRDHLIALLERHLPGWRFTPPAGGLFLWTKLPAPISTVLSVAAGERGLLITPGPRFGAAGLLERRLRLPFTLPPEQLEQAVAILAEVAAEPTRRRPSPIRRRDEPAAYVA